MPKYDPNKIEKKWQKRWLEERIFVAHDDSAKQKYYQLETFPYPSGAGLHVGHLKGYIAEDIHARYMRMRGKEVLYTMGWDAFGLPTENFAIKIGKSPKEVTKENTDNFCRQVRMFGLSYDWDREIDTSSPEYYRWTQWLFIQLFKKGLAYRKKQAVNWCPKDQTVLANEQVVNGKCERCGSEVEERDMEQWFFKITQYADRLLTDLKDLDWPAATVKRQEDWIGKSEGAEIKFQATSDKKQFAEITVFTTRPDTLFGATYLVLAPEHSFLRNPESKIKNQKEVQRYIDVALHKTERMRQEDAKEKTGVELNGVKAINPGNGKEIPIWVADYVLGSYGTGAIMAVPAHDERDFEFAKKYKLPIIPVISPVLVRHPAGAGISRGAASNTIRIEGDLWEGDGELINSGKFDGMDSEKAKWEITKLVGGKKKIQYKIRDWSVSRQRYWGVPIPMIYCEQCALRDPSGHGIVPVPENELPVILPHLENYRPRGVPPLASSPEFINVACPQCGAPAQRDSETLDTFVDSSWYYLRYADPHNAKMIFDKAKVAHWMPVDLYVIGAEHTVLHLLYSRFITKFLQDIGLLGFGEPFLKLRHQGLIRGADGQKMSKSKGNVVNPDEIVKEFGADTVRLYEMFMGPFEDGAPWDPRGVLGVERFLKRMWSYVITLIDIQKKKTYQFAATDPLKKSILHKTIKKVGDDIEAFKFNTAISTLMILLNSLNEANKGASGTFAILDASDLQDLIKLLHPFVPHMAQELWSLAGNEGYLDSKPWPSYDSALIKEDMITLVVQINGKIRDTISVDVSMKEADAKERALKSEKVRVALSGKKPKRIVYVPRKIINIVI